MHFLVAVVLLAHALGCAAQVQPDTNGNCPNAYALDTTTNRCDYCVYPGLYGSSCQACSNSTPLGQLNRPFTSQWDTSNINGLDDYASIPYPACKVTIGFAFTVPTQQNLNGLWLFASGQDSTQTSYTFALYRYTCPAASPCFGSCAANGPCAAVLDLTSPLLVTKLGVTLNAPYQWYYTPASSPTSLQSGVEYVLLVTYDYGFLFQPITGHFNGTVSHGLQKPRKFQIPGGSVVYNMLQSNPGDSSCTWWDSNDLYSGSLTMGVQNMDWLIDIAVTSQVPYPVFSPPWKGCNDGYTGNGAGILICNPPQQYNNLTTGCDRCLSGFGTAQCVSCPAVPPRGYCNDGFYGTAQVRCFPPFTLQQPNTTCGCTAPRRISDDGASCDACIAGYFGSSCALCRLGQPQLDGSVAMPYNTLCSDGFHGTGAITCSYPTLFNATNNNCSSCAAGYYGQYCTACPAPGEFAYCDDGYWGSGQPVCNVPLVRTTGVCDCPANDPRYIGTGPYCNNTCPNCPTETSLCSGGAETINGFCQCRSGFVRASNAQSSPCGCYPGVFGSSCQYACPSCAIHQVCDDNWSGSGQCKCATGYANVTGHCDCADPNVFGPACDQFCSSCDPVQTTCVVGVNGGCVSKCPTGQSVNASGQCVTPSSNSTAVAVWSSSTAVSSAASSTGGSGSASSTAASHASSTASSASSTATQSLTLRASSTAAAAAPRSSTAAGGPTRHSSSTAHAASTAGALSSTGALHAPQPPILSHAFVAASPCAASALLLLSIALLLLGL